MVLYIYLVEVNSGKPKARPQEAHQQQENVMDKAEYEARAACSGLGFSEEQIQGFIKMHTDGEARRARNDALTNAIINVAVSPWRDVYQAYRLPDHKELNADYGKEYGEDRERKSDFQRETERWDNKRNRGET